MANDQPTIRDLLALLRKEDFEGAVSRADELLAAAPAAQRPALEACRQLAHWLGPALSGHGAAGLPQAIASLAVLEREGHGPSLDWTRSAIGFAMGMLGKVETGLEWIERAIGNARLRGDALDLSSSLGAKAAVLTLFGSYGRAQDTHAEVARLSVGVPDHDDITENNNFASCCILAARELPADAPRRSELATQALDLATGALLNLAPAPWTWRHAWSSSNQGHALRLLGRTDEAEAAYNRALSVAVGPDRYLTDTAANLAALLTDSGRHDEAQKWIDIAMAQADTSLHEPSLDLILETQARLHAAAGRAPEALAASERRYLRLRQRYGERVENALSDETLRALEQARHEESSAREQARVLQAAATAKNRFLARMSHEIRTPIHAILGLAQLLEGEPLALAQAEQVGGILEAGDSLLRVVDDILDLSKIEAGQLRMECRPFSAAGVFQRVEGQLGRAAAARGLALRVDASALDGLWLEGDAHRVEQLTTHLVGNAVKFTERGSVGVLATKRELPDGRVELRAEVSDTGVGIPSAALDRLFTPFTQADEGIARQFGGNGLGLAICKSVVEQLGGRIGVDSEEGVGSRFWFEIALHRCEPDAQAPPAANLRSDGHGRLEGLRVLAVDDNRMNQLVVRRLLEREGAVVRTGWHGAEALRILDTEPTGFDVVLMDLHMPVMDGLLATRAIRADGRWATLPVLALTASTVAQDLSAAEAAGVSGHLAKPIRLEQLVDALAGYRKLPGSNLAAPD